MNAGCRRHLVGFRLELFECRGWSPPNEWEGRDVVSYK